ncbi:MAG: iron-containing redox enzyme family protein [Chloroflexi bacterium]|nr:iron-containing redox enzyme family protein [Chloroflexota bacterium]
MTTTAAEQALGPDAFVDSLFAWQSQVVQRPKLWEGILSGQASKGAVAAFLKEKFFLHWHSEPEIAAMIALAKDRDTMMALAKNFSREAGFYQTENHTELYVQFCEAFGLNRSDLISHTPLPETIGAFYTLSYFRRASLEEAVAAFSLASEGRKRAPKGEGSGALKQSEAFMKHYGLSERDVLFWSIHEGEVEDEDIATGIELVKRFISSPDQQRRARHAFEMTTLTKQHMYEACDRFLTIA